MKNIYLKGRNDASFGTTNDFHSEKENIWFALTILSDSETRVRVGSRIQHEVCLEFVSSEIDNQIKLRINNMWNYPNIAWSNYYNYPVWTVPEETHSALMRLIFHDAYE